MESSVVIPLYNKALHIERALRSVLAQTCQDFEVIVVNDGSTDNGPEIVGNIRDARVRLINQSNQGASVARNRGAETARYRYVAFLDADDEWMPEYLQDIQALIYAFPNCGAYAAAKTTIRPDGRTYSLDLSKVPPEPWIGILPNIFELLQDGGWLHSSATVVPKEVLAEVGGFPPGVKLLEDVTCWVKIAIRYPIAYTPRRLVVYHQDATNRSNIHKNLNEAPFVGIIRDAISEGLIAREQQAEALEFIAQRQIFTSIANVMNGNPVYARRLLATCSQTRKYKKAWLWWRFWASLPSGYPGKLMFLKDNFLDLHARRCAVSIKIETSL